MDIDLESCWDRRQFLLVTAAVAVATGAGRGQSTGRRDPASDLAWHITFLTNQQRGWRRLLEL
ncbi:MAG TPA: hypothetical protein VK911_05850, partial [Vicinamibacterales bacterium]|nr:hypothetical protein [Vicinamibacterales bacterium]